MAMWLNVSGVGVYGGIGALVVTLRTCYGALQIVVLLLLLLFLPLIEINLAQ